MQQYCKRAEKLYFGGNEALIAYFRLGVGFEGEEMIKYIIRI